MFVPKFKIIGPVVAEKSLIEKMFTHTHTHTHTHCYEKTKNIYLLYTRYDGGIYYRWGKFIVWSLFSLKWVNTIEFLVGKMISVIAAYIGMHKIFVRSLLYTVFQTTKDLQTFLLMFVRLILTIF